MRLYKYDNSPALCPMMMTGAEARMRSLDAIQCDSRCAICVRFEDECYICTLAQIEPDYMYPFFEESVEGE